MVYQFGNTKILPHIITKSYPKLLLLRTNNKGANLCHSNSGNPQLLDHDTNENERLLNTLSHLSTILNFTAHNYSNILQDVAGKYNYITNSKKNMVKVGYYKEINKTISGRVITKTIHDSISSAV